VRGQMLVGKVTLEQRLVLPHALADFPDRIVRHPFLRVLLRG
jgi:hypothetical protein